MRRMAAIPEPRTTVVFLRWRVGRTFFWGPAVVEHARKKTKSGFERTHITVLLFTLTPLWVLGEGGLCCIATALRRLGHQRRREMVRSDKFVGPFTNVMKSWVTWGLRSIWPDVPL